MKIKICGMKHPENIKEISQLKPDFMGFIFFEGSKRYVGDEFSKEMHAVLPKETIPVAVTVNETTEKILWLHQNLGFDFFQLHGEESEIQIEEIKKAIPNIKLIKAFGVSENFVFEKLNSYEPFVDFFLFDTKGRERGGNGLPFDWSLLRNYTSKKPYWLSGGLGEENLDQFFSQLINIPSPYLLDLNSLLEDEPGLKNFNKCKRIIQKINRQFQ